MTHYLDTNFVYAILFADAHTARAFQWLRTNAKGLVVGDWAAAEIAASSCFLPPGHFMNGLNLEAGPSRGIAGDVGGCVITQTRPSSG